MPDMRRRAKWGFVVALIVLCITISRIVYGPDLSEVAFHRVHLGSVIATLILILAACVVLFPVATDLQGGGQVGAIFALFTGACAFVGFGFELWFFGQPGALIGPAALIGLGTPSFAISSMFAWLLSRDKTPNGEPASHAGSGT